MKDCAVIVQARMSSRRFPGKMMASVGGMPLVEYMYRRCRQSRVEHVIIATSVDKSDDRIYDFCQAKNIPVYRGSLEDVLQRYIDAAQTTGCLYIARVCGDTPLVDVRLMEQLLSVLMTANLDYAAYDRNACLSCFYSEAITLEALRKSRSLTQERDHLAHVTKFVIEHPDIFAVKLFDRHLVSSAQEKPRLTIDYPQDVERVNRILGLLPNQQVFTSEEVIRTICVE